MDYNEPFTGGVERTYHDAMLASARLGHKNTVFPVSMGTRKTLPEGTEKISSLSGRYDIAIVEVGDVCTRFVGDIKSMADKVVIKSQNANYDQVRRLTQKYGPLTYLLYTKPGRLAASVHKDNKFYYRPPIVDTSLWFRDESVIRAEKTVLYVGRVAPSKGISRLMYVANALPDHEFVMVGSSNVKSEIQLTEKLIREINTTGNVVWRKGFVRDDILLKYYNKASALIVPSIKETFGHQIIESLLCETPVTTMFTVECSSERFFRDYIRIINRERDVIASISSGDFKSVGGFRSELEERFGIESGMKFLNDFFTRVMN